MKNAFGENLTGLTCLLLLLTHNLAVLVRCPANEPQLSHIMVDGVHWHYREQFEKINHK